MQAEVQNPQLSNRPVRGVTTLLLATHLAMNSA
jgi:hypothetical protein